MRDIRELYVPEIYWSRLVEFDGHWFIAQQSLEQHDAYYGADVGDIIVIGGRSGLPIFFELAGRVHAYGPSGIDGWMIVRIDPERAFDDLPVIDVKPTYIEPDPPADPIPETDGEEETPDGGG